MDTVVLLVNLHDFKITDPFKFDPVANDIHSKKYRYSSYRNNPPKNQYGPQMTIMVQPNQKIVLKIQVSVPKLLYGSNIYQTDPNDEDQFYYELKRSALKQGVNILAPIGNLEVIGFDPCINIELTLGCTAETAIRYIYHGYCTKLYSFDKRDFRDQGHAVYLHTGNWNFVFYDKVADILKPSGQRVDKESKRDNPLFEQFKHKQILRLELHARDRRKLKKTIQAIYPNIEIVTLKVLFNEYIWKRLLREFFIDQVLIHNKITFTLDDNPFVWMTKIRQDQPSITEAKILELLALVYLMKDPEGLKVYRRDLERRKGLRIWQRTMEKIKYLNQLVLVRDYFQFIHDIDKALWYLGCGEIV